MTKKKKEVWVSGKMTSCDIGMHHFRDPAAVALVLQSKLLKEYDFGPDSREAHDEEATWRIEADPTKIGNEVQTEHKMPVQIKATHLQLLIYRINKLHEERKISRPIQDGEPPHFLE